jgi:hypothetical protein
MKKRDLFIVLLILMNVALIIKNAVLGRNIRTLNALSPSGKIFAPRLSELSFRVFPMGVDL